MQILYLQHNAMYANSESNPFYSGFFLFRGESAHDLV